MKVLKPLIGLQLLFFWVSGCSLIMESYQGKAKADPVQAPVSAVSSQSPSESVSSSEPVIENLNKTALNNEPDKILPPINKFKKLRFITVGDTGTGGQKQYEVARAMEEKCKKSGCDFAVFLGDNIYNNGVTGINDPQFNTKFEKPYEKLNLKFYMVLGNHDYRGDVQAQIDYSKISKKWVMPARTYSINQDLLDLFAIDTNQPSPAQTVQLKDRLNQSKAPWKIVFGHHPRYTNGVYKNATSQSLAKMLDTAICNKADMYLSGHEHDKQHLEKVCGVEHLIVGTGAGIRPTGTGPNTLFAKSSYGFSWFEIDEKSLFFQILDTSGKVEYQYTMKK